MKVSVFFFFFFALKVLKHLSPYLYLTLLLLITKCLLQCIVLISFTLSSQKIITKHHELCIILCCCCSVTQLCPTLCDPTNCSMPGLPVPHHLPKFAQLYLYCISDVIQPSHPLTTSSLSAPNPSHNNMYTYIIQPILKYVIFLSKSSPTFTHSLHIYLRIDFSLHEIKITNFLS